MLKLTINVLKIEQEAKQNLQNRKGEFGQFSTYEHALSYFHKKMYLLFRQYIVNQQINFNEDIEPVLAENAELKQKERDMQGQIVALTHHKKQLSEQCIVLQKENERLRTENKRLSKQMP